MSLYQYLQLQPVDPQDDGSVSALDTYDEDETIDLTEETDGDELIQEWDQIIDDLHETAANKARHLIGTDGPA